MRRKILLVDDDPYLLEVLTCTFNRAGYSTVTAGNGVDALELAHSFSPDLIVLDLMLPEKDGFSVCESLRRERATSCIPVIMLTGMISQLSRFVGMSCGADDYVMKPITPEEFLQKVQNFFAERSGHGVSWVATRLPTRGNRSRTAQARHKAQPGRGSPDKTSADAEAAHPDLVSRG